METLPIWTTFGFAFFGFLFGLAGLVVSLYGVYKDRRRLLICFETHEKEDHEQAIIRLINTGHRPITIISAAVFLAIGAQKKRIRKNKMPVLPTHGAIDVLPDSITLTDGQDKVLQFTEEFTQSTLIRWAKAGGLRITAYDAEGNPHSNVRMLVHMRERTRLQLGDYPEPEYFRPWRVKRIW